MATRNNLRDSIKYYNTIFITNKFGKQAAKRYKYIKYLKTFSDGLIYIYEGYSYCCRCKKSIANYWRIVYISNSIFKQPVTVFILFPQPYIFYFVINFSNILLFNINRFLLLSRVLVIFNEAY